MDKVIKEFPQRHISDVESFRTLVNEVLDYYSAMEKEYNEVKNELEKTRAGSEALLKDFEALMSHNKELESQIQELTKPQEKKPLKRLDKKPLKRIK